VELGYALSCEEHRPADLVRYAREAEESGFSFALISDHFHPWIDAQGQSPFVWSVVGAIAERTERLRLGTGVTCPIIRIHPAIVAQAAATSAALMEGRFFLGVGTGEALNEHVTGERWPGAEERLEMLEEAIWVMRRLWQGHLVTHHGRFFTVDRARIYTLPDELPPIAVAASGERASELAGRVGDALVSTSPDADVVSAFEEAGGGDKPRYGQLTVCYAASEREAVETAHSCWPNAAAEGELTQELPLPRHFEQAAGMVTPEEVAEAVVCGPDPERYRRQIDEFGEAGFDHVYIHQVGRDQEGFLRFARSELALATHR
jgi:coenzyme F420-dependent glucose-6-phosphate dehydrogenase